MNTSFDKDEREAQQDSEVTLSTGTLLAVFFGLVVVCAVFFGFGYSMGRHSSDAKAAAAESAETAATGESIVPGATRPKPSALEVLPPPAQQAAASPEETAPRTVVDQEANAASTAYPSRPVAAAAHQQPAPVVAPPVVALKPRAVPRIQAATPVAAPVATPAAAQPSRPLPKPAGTGQSMVQIAAVSHPEDAEALVAALKKRGYTVSVRNEPQDKLLRVQVGPFANHADAVTMRQKLLSDGYNAIIK